MKKVLDREKIIKAAECCGEQKLCRDCPYNSGSRYCMYILREDTRLLLLEPVAPKGNTINIPKWEYKEESDDEQRKAD